MRSDVSHDQLDHDEEMNEVIEFSCSFQDGKATVLSIKLCTRNVSITAMHCHHILEKCKMNISADLEFYTAASYWIKFSYEEASHMLQHNLLAFLEVSTGQLTNTITDLSYMKIDNESCVIAKWSTCSFDILRHLLCYFKRDQINSSLSRSSGTVSQQSWMFSGDQTEAVVVITCQGHWYNGEYCRECRKGVCMCTVKDHLVQLHNVVYTNKIKIMLKSDKLAAIINLDNRLLQLLLSNSSVTSATIIITDHVQFDQYKNGSDDGMHFGLGASSCVINSFVPVTSAISFDQDDVHCHKIDCSDIMISLDESGIHDYKYQDTSLVSFLLFFALVLSLFCNEITNERTAGSHVSTDSLQKDHRSFNNLDKLENALCKEENGGIQYSALAVTINSNNLSLSVALDVNVLHHQGDVISDVVRPIGKDTIPVSSATNQQSFTDPLGHEGLAPQEDLHNVTESVTAIGQTEGEQQQEVQQPNAITEDKDQPLKEQPNDHSTAVSNTNIHLSHLEKSNVERDGHTSFCAKNNTKVMASNLEQNVVEKDGMLSMESGIDQATPISSIPEHKLMIGNTTPKPVRTADHTPSGAHMVKGISKQTELLPTVGPQLDALYNTNFDREVQSSREEVRQRARPKTTFYQHEVEQAYNPIRIDGTNPPVNDKLQVRVPAVKTETDKAANDFKPKPLPRRSHIVCGNLQYPLVSNLISHPHMDHYFVKERTEIRPSHYMAKLVLRHQYLNRDDVNEDTTAVTAAQQSQAAVLAADSAVEKDGAVTERKHFPMNLNMPGFVVFSSDLTRFTGNMKYPLPSRKATAIKLGKGGNGFVFAIFHNGKEYAVKKTVYRPVEIRVHSQLSHPNLVNLDAVLIGEEHEKHKGKFYAFCFMTKCDMDFRSVISTKEHGCLKHLKLQLSNQRDVWQLVMVNVKYVLRSVLKAIHYMHKLGLVHRDVKASNVLLKMQCHCTKPLMCACPQKYLVKLGDFDSSTTVPGYGLKIEPHQTIRYASVLPLGTMGYRAPEVSMHLVIAGPYEVLYTTAVDIWSFGCLLLNMLIGKSGPLRQRGEASLLLSTQEQPYAESLYTQIIKVKELQKYYGDMPEMVDLVQKCLQVKVHCRPSAKQLLQLDVLQCI